MRDKQKVEPCPVCGTPPIVSGGKGETVWVKCCAIRLVVERWNPYAVERRKGREVMERIRELRRELNEDFLGSL